MRTSLFNIHKSLGARIVEFAGWEMPVEYAGIRAEHMAVREKAGLFDVSHMGEIEITGQRALDLVQKITCNDAARLPPGRSQYSALLTPQGTFIDDIMVYRLAEDHFLLCVNASNKDKDFDWIHPNASRGTDVRDTSNEWALLALQGPLARQILPSTLKKTYFEQTTLQGVPILLSCTGYTGEDGFEIFCPWDRAGEIWNFLLEKGRPHGLIPCGLGARDTLRLEAAYPLYGHEIDETTTPYEAGLPWIVKMEKGGFIGREALAARSGGPDEGLKKRLTGMTMVEPGIPRQGYRLFVGEEEVGRVTSGTFSPFFNKGIAMAFVTPPLTKGAFQEKKVWIEIREKKREAALVPLPFYKRTYDVS